MAEVTVSQFAEVLKVPVDRLLVQLDQAGIKVEGPDARSVTTRRWSSSRTCVARMAAVSQQRAARPARSPEAQDAE